MASSKKCGSCNDDRREFLKNVGKTGIALGFMGLSLQSRLFMQDVYGAQPRDAFYDAALQIFFNGGPSQTDSFDPKPGSRNNVFDTVNLGVQDAYGEDIHLPNILTNLANLATSDPDVGLGLIRSMVHRNNNHETSQRYMNSFWEGTLTSMYPSTAAVMSYYFQGQGIGIPSVVVNGNNGTEANVARMSRVPTALQVNAGGGAGTNPIVQSLERPAGVDEDRYRRRRSLVERLNERYLRSRPDDMVKAYERASEDAASITLQGDAARAFDLTGVPLLPARDNGTSRRLTQAMRLIDAGVPYVSCGIGGNDSHNNNRAACEGIWGNSVDQGVVEMVQRLKASGKRVLITLGGEFGRTPQTVANGRDGRDHWGDGFSWGMISINQPRFRTSAIGDTGPDGMYRERDGNLVDPMHPRDFGAFVYRSLGFQVGVDVNYDIPMNDREAPPVDRQNKSDQLLRQFGLTV